MFQISKLTYYSVTMTFSFQAYSSVFIVYYSNEKTGLTMCHIFLLHSTAWSMMVQNSQTTNIQTIFLNSRNKPALDLIYPLFTLAIRNLQRSRIYNTERNGVFQENLRRIVTHILLTSFLIIKSFIEFFVS